MESVKWKKINIYKEYMDIAHFIFINVGLGDLDTFPLYQKNLKIFKKLNPDTEVRLWSEDELDNLVETHFSNLLEVWNTFPDKFYKIDFGRYLILKTFGGIYIDLDMECIKPLDMNQDYINVYCDKNGKDSFNNNVICFRNRTMYDKIIEFSLFRIETNKMPKSWLVRRFLYTVSARMYHMFCKMNGLKATNVNDYFIDYETKCWLKSIK